MDYIEIVKELDAVTATGATTGEWVDVGNAKKITFYFKRSAHSSGSSAFTIDTSVDKTEVFAYSRGITNVTNTNSQTITRGTTHTLSSNTTTFVSVSPEDAIKFIRAKVTNTTDGTANCWMVVQR